MKKKSFLFLVIIFVSLSFLNNAKAVCPSGTMDRDGDGYCADTDSNHYETFLGGKKEDCDDSTSSSNPSISTDGCDGLDNDCDTAIDENATFTIYRIDQDGDGQPIDDCSELSDSSTCEKNTCSAPTGYVIYTSGSTDEDCDDTNPNVLYDRGIEDCDGLDNDCDGLTDERENDSSGFFSVVDEGRIDVYQDSDGDGYGDPDVFDSGCPSVSYTGFVENDDDCDDSDSTLPIIYYRDSDGDGFGSDTTTTLDCSLPTGYVTNNEDCNDGNASYSSIATYYRDADNDGFGNPLVTTSSCGPSTGYVGNSNDCDDTKDSVNPSATEICGNGIDENCTSGDLACTPTSTDDDGDGDPNTTDCDDTNASIFTGASETCSNLGVDNDCDGDSEEASFKPLWFQDADGDEYGNPGVSTQACTQPSGYVGDFSDCDDTNASVNPSTTEDDSLCEDGLDNDCLDGDLLCPESTSGGSSSGTDSTGSTDSGSSTGSDTSGDTSGGSSSTDAGSTTTGTETGSVDGGSISNLTSGGGGCSLKI